MVIAGLDARARNSHGLGLKPTIAAMTTRKKAVSNSFFGTRSGNASSMSTRFKCSTASRIWASASGKSAPFAPNSSAVVERSLNCAARSMRRKLSPACCGG